MNKRLLLVVASLAVLGLIGCKSADESTGAATPPPTKAAAPVSGPKAGSPGQAGSATVGLNPNADASRFMPGNKSH